MAFHFKPVCVTMCINDKMFLKVKALKLKRQTITNVDEDVEKLDLLHIAGMIGKWCSHFGKKCGNSSKG